MRYCIPDELFNRIPYPRSMTGNLSVDETTLDGIYGEIAYKLPGAEEVVVRREVWHSLVDFCVRTGAYLKRLTTPENEYSIYLEENLGGCEFLRVVGAEVMEGDQWEPTEGFTIDDVSGHGLMLTFNDNPSSGAAIISVRPQFDDAANEGHRESGVWTPKVPRYFLDRYGECVTHGALARIYAQRGEAELARMHATAYNNDLNRLSFGLITSGMRKHLLIDIEDWLVNTQPARARAEQQG